MITCAFENGNSAELRHVTVSTIVVKDEKILLGKRALVPGKIMLEAGKWGLLGGYMSRDESATEAAAREILEESGWEVTDIQPLLINTNPHRPAEDRQNVDFVFVARATTQHPTKDDEVSRLQWFAPDDLPPQDQIAFDHADALEMYRKNMGHPTNIILM